jgi:hypothetical protein
MSFGDTLTIGTLTFKRVNFDNYSTEYFQRDATDERRLFISHQTEQKLVNGMTMERHLVKYQKRTFATATEPEYLSEFYSVFRVPAAIAASSSGGADTLVRFLSDDVAAASNDNIVAVLGWES